MQRSSTNLGWLVSESPFPQKSNGPSISSASFRMRGRRPDPIVSVSLLTGSHIQLCTGEIPAPLSLLPLHTSDGGQVIGNAESSAPTTRSTVTRKDGARRQRGR